MTKSVPAQRRQEARRAEAARARRTQARRRLAVIIAGTAILAAVGVWAFTAGSSGDGSVTEPTAFDLPAIEGEGRIRLADFRGSPVVVNFFASWCTACDAELPGFSTISRELEGEVAFIGVNALETGDPLLMPERHDITWWPLARDVGRQGDGLHRALGGRGMPITAFYDEQGALLHVDGGALPEDALRDRLQEYYGIAPPAT